PQVAVGRWRRTDAHRAVGELDVERVAVGRRVHRDGLDPELVQCADHAHGDLAPVRDEHSLEHRCPQTAGGVRTGSSSNRSSPYSTGCALAAWIERTMPAVSDLSSLNSFIASRMQRIWPGTTVSPT